jgi:SAM-dependent methyltransferase
VTWDRATRPTAERPQDSDCVNRCDLREGKAAQTRARARASGSGNVPTVQQNLEKWNESYDWELSEHQWSGNWGGAASQWFGSIYPRVRPFLPAGSVLEIAPGFGRWTQFLLQNCETLIGVDLTPKCVEACRSRFGDRDGATFYVNDGSSLPMVESDSIDFAFSYDSLVHAEADVLAGYLAELARCLRADGVAFIHHSNHGQYKRSTTILSPIQPAFDKLPGPAKKAFYRVGLYRGYHWRSPNVTAGAVAELCEQVGLRCIGQELINWAAGAVLVDCISVVTRPGSRFDHPNRVVKNRLFRLEARSIKRSSAVYSAN